MSGDYKAEREKRLIEVNAKERRLVEILEKYPKLELVFNFSCGGDCMGDTDLDVRGNEDVPREIIEEVEGIVEEVVYENVNFYINSDGHYIGESGTVTVELDDEGELTWNKNGEAEFSETSISKFEINLKNEGFAQSHIAYLKQVVAGVLLDEWADEGILFREDVVITPDEQLVLDKFHKLLYRESTCSDRFNLAKEEAIAEYNGFEPQDEVVLCTNEDMEVSDTDSLKIEDETLTFYYQIRGYVFVPSEY